MSSSNKRKSQVRQVKSKTVIKKKEKTKTQMKRQNIKMSKLKMNS